MNGVNVKMEIMLDDLKPQKQKEVLSFLGLENPQEGNYDVVPLFIIADIRAANDAGQEHYDRLVISLLASKQKRKVECIHGSKSLERKA